jgi:dihydrofolate reductase
VTTPDGGADGAEEARDEQGGAVTHRTGQDRLGDNGGRFAFDGLEAATRRAKPAAGDKDVLVLGADVARQLLKAGLLDEVRIHLVPLLMGEGTPLFAGSGPN